MAKGALWMNLICEVWQLVIGVALTMHAFICEFCLMIDSKS